MKKEKTIRITSTEEIKSDDLTDREKAIYDAGYEEGEANGYFWMAIIIAFMFLAIYFAVR